MNFYVGKVGSEYVAHELPLTDNSLHFSSNEIEDVAHQLKNALADRPWEVVVQSKDMRLSPLDIAERSKLLDIIDSRT